MYDMRSSHVNVLWYFGAHKRVIRRRRRYCRDAEIQLNWTCTDYVYFLVSIFTGNVSWSCHRKTINVQYKTFVSTSIEFQISNIKKNNVLFDSIL